MPRLPVTDPVLLKELQRQGINPADVDFDQDYAPRSLGKRHSPHAKFYTTFAGAAKGKQFMVVSGLSMVDADGVKCDPKWVQTGNTYHAKSNVFSALVNDIPGRITLTVKNDDAVGRKKNDKVVLIPQLFLNGVEVPRPSAVLLPVDPLNANYLENTLEWDYGICKRRLRQVEGRIHGYWVFSANPNGDVRIVYNQTGQYRLKLGQYATDADTEVISASVFASATYPFTVSDSATYYPDAHVESTSVDGQVRRYLGEGLGEAWATIVAGAGVYAADGGTENKIPIVADKAGQTNKWMAVGRLIFLFDTSGLPDTATVSAAVLSLYGSAKSDPLSITPNINIYTSTPASNTALVAADFGQVQAVAQSTAITYANWSTTGYNGFSLNDLTKISLDGVSKFGARNVNYDVAANAPAWTASLETYIESFMSEFGADYKPKLVVTYTAPVDYPKTSSVAMGFVSVTTRGFDKTSSLALGMAVTALRGTIVARTSEVAMGLAVTAVKVKDVPRVASIVLGMAVTSLRATVVSRTSGVAQGFAVTVTRVADFPRTASSVLGMAVTSAVVRGIGRTASVVLGMATTVTRATAIARIASLAQGLAVTVTRATEIARAVSTSLGYAVTATRTGAWAITSSVALGLAVTASRSWGRTRDASVSFGHAVSAIMTQRYVKHRAQTGTNRDRAQTGTNRDREPF